MDNINILRNKIEEYLNRIADLDKTLEEKQAENQALRAEAENQKVETRNLRQETDELRKQIAELKSGA